MGNAGKVGVIQFEIKNLVTEDQNDAFEKRYRATINTQHDADPADESAIYIWNRYMDNIQMAKGIRMIRVALWVIGIFTLLSGIVGVSNIMLITVKERTREFGIRKAIGAGRGTIMLQFLVEALTISLIGCVIGIIFSWIILLIVNVVGGVSFCLNTTVVGVSIIFSLAIGMIFGMYTANKAATMLPIDALRFEG